MVHHQIDKGKILLKFTVVIPTRNRPDTFLQTLNNVLDQDYSDFQVLVADNSSGDATFDIVRNVNDPRVKYLKTGPGLSMSANWERALGDIDDGWVTFLGDDDALLPGSLLKVNDLAQRYSVSAIRSNGANYTWPGDGNHPHGYIHIVIDKKPQMVESSNAVMEVLNGYRLYSSLPMLYNGGFVDLSLIRLAKQKNPVFYHSRIPDVYSAFAFAFLTENYLLYNYPLAINGASRHSGGTAFFQHSEESHGYLSAKLFLDEDNLPLHSGVPLVGSERPLRSIQAHVLECYLQAKDAIAPQMPDPNFYEQLKLIIKDAKEIDSVLIDWTQNFSEIHKLRFNPEELKMTTKIQKTRFFDYFRPTKLYSVARRLKNQPKAFEVVGTKDNPLDRLDVAAQIIGSIVSRY